MEKKPGGVQLSGASAVRVLILSALTCGLLLPFALGRMRTVEDEKAACLAEPSRVIPALQKQLADHYRSHQTFQAVRTNAELQQIYEIPDQEEILRWAYTVDSQGVIRATVTTGCALLGDSLLTVTQDLDPQTGHLDFFQHGELTASGEVSHGILSVLATQQQRAEERRDGRIALWTFITFLALWILFLGVTLFRLVWSGVVGIWSFLGRQAMAGKT